VGAHHRILATTAALAASLAFVACGAGSSGSTTGSQRRTSTSSGAATAARASTGVPTPTPAPVLMYHVIAAPPADAPYPGLYVPPAEFREQMQALRRAGFQAVTQQELREHWLHGLVLPPGKPVVLTFDNGYQSQYSQALPVLRSIGWVGVENMQLQGLPPSQGGFGTGMVEGLIHAGWELNTQGLDHADLTTLGAAELEAQVAGSRRIIQRRYHVPVNWFCYPSGHYNAAVVEAVKRAGYVGSTTVIPGWAHADEDPYRMHRLRVLGGTSGSELIELIDGTRENPPAPASYEG
jgi:peptidoglycan/xylan/chitin deacetylase (PgdA/CDA1 family)